MSSLQLCGIPAWDSCASQAGALVSRGSPSQVCPRPAKQAGAPEARGPEAAEATGAEDMPGHGGYCEWLTIERSLAQCR
ncbi:hypothetical protein Z046_24345 [Pseudomonas aeruginosa VRFPA09]|nr:hypothetical protein Z046_24345 [Pseudomonas aeruginosa VRFPA09]